jgi:hypothetical protein
MAAGRCSTRFAVCRRWLPVCSPLSGWKDLETPAEDPAGTCVREWPDAGERGLYEPGESSAPQPVRFRPGSPRRLRLVWAAGRALADGLGSFSIALSASFTGNSPVVRSVG